MKIEYTICDKCGKPVPEATGAIVIIYGGKPTAHLCEKCLDEVLPPTPETTRLAKGAEEEGGGE